MKSLRVIEHDDVFQYVLLCFMASLVVLPLHLLLLQAAKEALNDRIIPTIALAAHAAFKSVSLEQPPEGFTGILRTPVRMMDQTGLRPASPDGHFQCITITTARYNQPSCVQMYATSEA